ncbi:MAG: RNA polymerase sigma factor [Deltaproteobacteria bacterium]|nr:RNA polymerase sigma factor [Deltaproteobacteria bacterium]
MSERRLSVHPGADPSVASDEVLLARIRERDSGALRALFQRYQGRMFHFVMRRLHDPGLAEEVVADVFFEVWRSIDRFQGASRPSTWIFGIANFKATGAHRDRSRLKRAAVVPTKVESLHRVADDGDADGRLLARDELRIVHRALDEMPGEQRELLELAVVEGLAYDEIARRLGVPEGTVKTRVSRARARLRRGLERRGVEDAGR